MNRNIHGNYAKLDKSRLQRHSLGELILMFRKYVYTGFKHRFYGEHIDVEAGEVVEGYYRTFLKQLWTDLFNLKLSMLTNWGNLTPRQRQNITKALIETTVFIGTSLAFGALEDDDDDSKMKTHVMLQLRRLNGDLAFFNPVGMLVNHQDIMRVLQNPTVTYSWIATLSDAIEYSVYDMVGSDEGKYKRKSGSHEEGDSKAWVKFKKIAPFLQHVENIENPEDLLEYYSKK
jgi:hypothetical protein